MTATSVFSTMAQDATLQSAKTRGAAGLVMVPFTNYQTSATATTASASVGKNSNGTSNPDGTSQKATLTTTAAIPNFSAVRDNIWGRVVGIRFPRNSTVFTVFDVVIDGVAYPVDETRARRNNVAGGAGDVYSMLIIADDLPDRLHTVEAIVTGSTAEARRTEIYGWIAEAGRGYPQTPRIREGATMVSATSLATTAAAITYAGVGAGLSFYNTDAANPHTVTIKEASGAIYRKVTIPADSGTTLTFAVPRALSGWTWQADTGSVVNAWAEVV